jgi:hypothetical protein
MPVAPGYLRDAAKEITGPWFITRVKVNKQRYFII